MSAPENPNYIVPLTYSSNIGFNEQGVLESRLTMMTRMAVDSAVEVWYQSPDPAFIVIPGETVYGPEVDNGTKLMKDRARHSGGIPESALLGIDDLPDGSLLNNTNLQVRATQLLLGYEAGRGQARVTMVGMNFHLPRIMQIARLEGLTAGARSVESILAGADRHDYDEYLPYVDKFKRAEPLLRLLNALNPSGSLINRASQLRGGRLADLSKDENGRIRVENTKAAHKLKQVLANGPQAGQAWAGGQA